MENKHTTQHNIRLTSSEIGTLWTTYVNDSMSTCVLSYFVNKVEDREISLVLEYALSLSKKHLERVTEILNHENHPVPIGFTEEDVNVNAPRLYSDVFFLNYIKLFSRLGLSYYGFLLHMVSRSDLRDFIAECIASSTALSEKADNVLLEKGVYIRPPYIPVPESAEFIQKQSFLNGFFGDKRPLNAVEITNIFANIMTNSLGKAAIIGFSQVAKTPAVKKYALRGADIAEKHVEVLSSKLRKEDIPAPTSYESDVMDSTASPFSEKLIMYHISALSQASQMSYGLAMGTCLRRDLGLDIARLMAEISKYAEDGAEIMIDHEWLEKIPGAVERRVLAST
jgi:hypothetical protein